MFSSCHVANTVPGAIKCGLRGTSVCGRIQSNIHKSLWKTNAEFSAAWSDLGLGKCFLQKTKVHSSVTFQGVPGGDGGATVRSHKLQSCSAHCTICPNTPTPSLEKEKQNKIQTTHFKFIRAVYLVYGKNWDCVGILEKYTPSIPGVTSSERIKGVSLPYTNF